MKKAMIFISLSKVHLFLVVSHFTCVRVSKSAATSVKMHRNDTMHLSILITATIPLYTALTTLPFRSFVPALYRSVATSHKHLVCLMAVKCRCSLGSHRKTGPYITMNFCDQHYCWPHAYSRPWKSPSLIHIIAHNACTFPNAHPKENSQFFCNVLCLVFCGWFRKVPSFQVSTYESSPGHSCTQPWIKVLFRSSHAYTKALHSEIFFLYL